MKNSSLTKDQICSDCMLGVTQAELSTPFGYNNASVAEFSSSASACGKATYTIAEPTPYVLSTVSPTPSAAPPLRSKDCPDRYQVRTGDTCFSISQANNVSTFGLLYWNSLALGCTNFPVGGKTICLPSPCSIYKVRQGDTCLSIIAQHAPDYSIRQLRSWNLGINNVCSNLGDMVGQSVCIGPPAVIASAAPPSSTPTGSPVTTPVAAPTNAAGGSNSNCGLWYTTVSGDICGSISGQYGISLKNFYFLNPAVDSNCSNLQIQTAYCVKPVGDITTYPGYDGAGSGTTAPCDVAFPAPTCYQDVATLTSVPFLESNATFTRAPSTSINTASRTVSRTTHTPSPTAPGSRKDCLYYAEYIKTGSATTDNSVNSCRGVAQYYGVTVSQLIEWNTSLKAASCVLSPRYAYCAFVRGGKSPYDWLQVYPFHCFRMKVNFMIFSGRDIQPR
jgi:LysM repeat protein